MIYGPQGSSCTASFVFAGDEVCLFWPVGITRQHSTERRNRRTGGLRMAKTHGSMMELIERNLRARRSQAWLSSALRNLFM